MRAGRSPAGRSRVIDRRSPAAVTPLTCAALPAWNAPTPATSLSRGTAGVLLPMRGDAARSIAVRKDCAVTGTPDGGENCRPGRMRNVHVRPSADPDGSPTAAWGTSFLPATPLASG